MDNPSKKQPADSLTKTLGALDNLRSLEMLQGQQPKIDALFVQYSQRRQHSRRPSQSSHIISAAISTDGYARLPYDLLDDDSDDIDAHIQVAIINSWKQESIFIDTPADRRQYTYELNRWAHYSYQQPLNYPFVYSNSSRNSRLSVSINTANNEYDRI